MAFTCSVSGLPIHAGDDIRCMLITQSPYEEIQCTIHDLWVPRTFPIKAKYDDYGLIHSIEEGFGPQLWLEGLKQDLMNVGVGDNIYDKPVNRNELSSIEDLIRFVSEQRVFVIRKSISSKGMRKLSRRKIPVGIPTMKRISKIIDGSNLPDKEHFIVDKKYYGAIKIRWNKYTDRQIDEKNLNELLPFITKKYAAVVKCGSGSYPFYAEMMVYPKPNDNNDRDYREPKNKPLAVSYLMIREDIWQALLNIDVREFWSRETETFEKDKEAIYVLYETLHKRHTEYLKRLSEVDNELDKSYCERDYRWDIEDIMGDYQNPVAPYLGKSCVPAVFDVSEHWKLFLGKCLVPEQAKDFLDIVAEFIHVQKVLGMIRYYWRPSYSRGPQFGAWGMHADFHNAVNNIATRKRDEFVEKYHR